MSDQSFKKSRRKFLKGAAYSSALTVGSLSGVAMANAVLSPNATSTDAAEAAKSMTKETVILFNQSGETVKLHADNPVNLEMVNGWAVVNINKQLDNTQPSINLAPGERQGFSVDSVLAPLLDTTGNYIVITSEFTALNNMIPISTVDVAVA